MIQHKDVGMNLNKGEWIATDAHVGTSSSGSIVVAASNSLDTSKASLYRFDYYDYANRDGDYHYSSATYWCGQAIAIASVAKLINRVRFYLQKTGSPTGNMVAKIYACTGTPGTNGKPTGAALATSGTIDIATYTSTLEWQPVEFIFATPYLAAVGNICVTCEFSGATQDNSNYVSIGYDGSSPSHAGNESYSSDGGSNWTAESGKDLCFELFSHFICDNTADEVQINAAIALVNNAGGGSVLLLEGTYTLSATITMMSNVMLTGQGYGSIIAHASTFISITADGSSGTHKVNMIIKDLQINAADPGSGTGAAIYLYYCDYAIIDNVYEHDHRHGLCIDVSTCIKIVNSTFYSNSQHGIWVCSYTGITKNILISNCYVSGNVLYGIYVDATSTYAANVEGVSIIGCHLQNTSYDVYALGGESSRNVKYLIIQNNIFYDGYSRAIYLYGGAASVNYGVQYFSIIGNCIYSPGSYGMYILCAQYGTISSNIVTESAGSVYGISLYYTSAITVTNNLVEKAHLHGIGLASYCLKTVIANNICLNNEQSGTDRAGIGVGGTGSIDTIAIGNVCSDNQAVKTQTYGISLGAGAGGDYQLVANNITIGNMTRGIASTLVGTNIAYDLIAISQVITLGTSQDIFVFSPQCSCLLMGVTLTAATASTTGALIRIGYYGSGANDDDYYLDDYAWGVKAKGVSVYLDQDDLLATGNNVGYAITVGCNASGTGTILVELHIALMGDVT